MAMVSVIQDQMVAKNKVINNEIILDAVSLASVLPGPLAVNVVTFVGYQLKGIKGALVSMLAVILPSFILILGLSWAYFEYGALPIAIKMFSGILPAVVAVIVIVSFRMAKLSISDNKQLIISILSGVLLMFFGGFFMTLILIIAGGFAGFILYHNSLNKKEKKHLHPSTKQGRIPYLFILSLAFLLVILILPIISSANTNNYFEQIRKLMTVFGGMSLTLFGGGYVFIPMIQETVVEHLQWLSLKEFADGIALGQITPGPILISATFIGYKVAGFLGAIVATTAIFLPSGLLMITGSHLLNKFKESDLIEAAFLGLRPAVIGMIFSASLFIGSNIDIDWRSILIFIFVLLMSFKYNLRAAILIPVSGLLGILLYSL